MLSSKILQHIDNIKEPGIFIFTLEKSVLATSNEFRTFTHSAFGALMKKIIGICVLLLCFALGASAQFPSSSRKITFALQDTIRLDSLSIRSETFQLQTLSGIIIPAETYRLYPLESYVVLNRNTISQQGLAADSLVASFKVYPFSFSKTYQNKSVPKIRTPRLDSLYFWTFESGQDTVDNNIFQFNGLDKNGSLSRGISFGNNRDLSVNSSFNLQLSGYLADSVSIRAAITDENIPVQPDGSTYRLQDFDKVFIEIGYRQHKLIAGDFYVTRPASHFLNVYKKAQGLQVQTSFSNAVIFGKEKPKGEIRFQGSGAISRGKFASNKFNGIEGNQGPYRLIGNDGETFITVLSGTERVFIDGVQLKRGRENDYVIDYNTAEISFTPKQQITKDRRITVEFEYSDRNYGRLLYQINNEWDLGKIKYKLNVFSEQDLRNQPLQQSLSDENKLLLRNVGDSLNLALTPSVALVDFNANEILYAKIDTIINGIPDTIYVYNTNPDSARYRVTFSMVGAGNGRYEQIQSTANGRVFRFVGAGAGSYEPAARLAAPQTQRMITFGTEIELAKGLVADGEMAYSYNDINTFSDKDNADNDGYAFRVNLTHTLPFGKEIDKKKINQFKWKAYYEQVEKTFTPFVRFRNVEFTRDLNLNGLNPVGNEYIPGLELEFKRGGLGRFAYAGNAFIKGSDFAAYRNQLDIQLSRAGWTFNNWTSYIFTNGSVANTNFFRHRTTLIKTWKKLQIGTIGEDERNVFKQTYTDSLRANSYMFNDWQAFIGGADSSVIAWKIYYRFRLDHLPSENELKASTLGHNTGVELNWSSHPLHQIKLNVGYRNLMVLDSSLYKNNADNSAVGRLEYNGRWLKGAVVWNTYYEIGSGLENKRQFAYLPVNNGQGTHYWDLTLDYNGNGVPDLDEFQPAQYNGQGNYIKIFTPSTEYVKTFDTKFNQTINLRFPTAWSGKKGIKKFLSKFFWQNVYSMDRKSQNPSLATIFNPFETGIQDTLLLSLNSTLRSSIFFNRSSGKIGLEFTYRELKNKVLLTNGIDSRQTRSGQFRSRYNINSFLTLNVDVEAGRKQNYSPFLRNRNFDLEFYSVDPKFVIQPGTKWRLTFSYSYKQKFNLRKIELGQSVGGEKARIHQAGIEGNVNILQKGLISGKLSALYIDFNGVTNSALGFEMIEALAPGLNGTWNLNVQYNLGQNIQVTVNYDGRAGKNFSAVHYGGMQVRAFF